MSPDGPVNDINAALQMASPGTDVMVKAGTYQGAVKFTRSGVEGAPIRLISADGKGKARIISDKTGLYGFGTKNVGSSSVSISSPEAAATASSSACPAVIPATCRAMPAIW